MGLSGGGRDSPGVSRRWLKAFTMAGSHGSAEAANTSVASIKSASQTVLGSALGKVGRCYPSARPICVEGMSHEDADAEQDTYCRDDLAHSFPPCLEANRALVCFRMTSSNRKMVSSAWPLWRARHEAAPVAAGSNSGRTSAPRRPHALQTNRCSISESLTWSGEPSARAKKTKHTDGRCSGW